jgi:hypothetical protein
MQALRDAYNSTWLDMPFTNLITIEETFLEMDDMSVIRQWLAGRLGTSAVARFSKAVKDRTQLSTEGGTCGPFAIIAAEKLDQRQWVIRYLHTGSHGAAVVYQRGNPNVLYLMDSTLRSVYSIIFKNFKHLPNDSNRLEDSIESTGIGPVLNPGGNANYRPGPKGARNTCDGEQGQ